MVFRLSAGGFAVLVAALLLSFWRSDAALYVNHWIGAGIVLLSSGAALALALFGTAVRAAWSPAQRSITALVAFALLAMTLSEIDSLGGIAYLAAKSIAGVAASSGLAAWFAWLGFRVFQDIESALQQRLGLGRIVREQQAQLKAQQEALEREIVRRAVLEERERFSRDVHDGVGGSLVSLLAQARTGVLKEADLEAELQRTLADLRLMIDALDHTQATLAAAFSTFQTRIAPVFAAAGIELAWRQDALEARELKDPLSLLHLFRILQEACTNVIRHAQATRASVRIAWNEQANALEIDVEDNGSATAAGAKSGHGLKNMAERAAKIGAAFAAGPAEAGQGWRVRLRAPGR
jgi:signal transduction histidine kinase